MTNYGCACEDGHYDGYINTSLGSYVLVDTTSGHFLSPNRCGLSVYGGVGAFLYKKFTAPQTQFWVGVRAWLSGSNNTQECPIQFMDANGVTRIKCFTSSPLTPENQNDSIGGFTFYKQDSSGNLTTLFNCIGGLSSAPTLPDKVDIYINYGTSGSMQCYINNVLVGSCSNVDLTTNGNTSIAAIGLGNCTTRNQPFVTWSGLDIDSNTTLGHDGYFRPPASLGDTDQGTGGVAEVGNETVSSANYDTTTSSGQIQLYKPGVSASGVSVYKVVDVLQVTQGVSGSLTNIQSVRKVAGTLYNSSSVAVPISPGIVEIEWDNNPATGVAWTSSDLNASTYQFGYESET